MKLDHPILTATGGFALATVVRHWMGTLRYDVSTYDRGFDPAWPVTRGSAIYIFWHEYIPFMFYLRGHCNIAMLLSQHRDAEFLSYAARYMGFHTVRGSTTRGGVSALREMCARGQSQNLTITPDGPRGPRRKVAPGCIFLASKLRIPLIPLGLGYDRPWRLERAWDKFAVPRPGSRAVGIIGPPIHIPKRLGRDGMERFQETIERALNELTHCAEHAAEFGYRLEQAACGRRTPRPLAIGNTTSFESTHRGSTLRVEIQ